MIQPTYTLGVLAGIQKDSRILLVRTQYAGDKWQLPGGYVEPSESVEEALRREIIEELGLRPAISGVVGTYIRQSDHNIVLLFDVELPVGALKLQEDEIEEAAYFGQSRLPERMSRRTKLMIEHVLQRRRGQTVLFAETDDPGREIG